MKLLFNKDYKELTDAIELLEREKYDKDKIIIDKNDFIDQLKINILELENENILLQDKESVNKTIINANEMQIKKIKSQLDYLVRKNNILKARIGGLTSSRNRLNKKINSLRNEISDCYTKLDNYKYHLKSLHVQKTPKQYIMREKTISKKRYIHSNVRKEN